MFYFFQWNIRLCLIFIIKLPVRERRNSYCNKILGYYESDSFACLNVNFKRFQNVEKVLLLQIRISCPTIWVLFCPHLSLSISLHMLCPAASKSYVLQFLFFYFFTFASIFCFWPYVDEFPPSLLLSTRVWSYLDALDSFFQQKDF